VSVVRGVVVVVVVGRLFAQPHPHTHPTHTPNPHTHTFSLE
jgi:hypothetical protein